MKITNASSKTVTLVTGKKIAPKAAINIKVEKGTDLYEQVKQLESIGILDIN